MYTYEKRAHKVDQIFSFTEGLPHIWRPLLI